MRQRQEELVLSRADLEELMPEKRDEVRDLAEIMEYVDDRRALLMEKALQSRRRPSNRL